MAKNDWHRTITQGLVDAVNMIVSDYKGEKEENAKQAALKEKEKLATKKEAIDGTGAGPYMPLDKKKGASKGGGKSGDYSKGYRPEESDKDDDDKKGEVKKGMPWKRSQFKAEAESGDAAAYKKFFTAALKKFDVSSPADLKGDKKKEFFDYVDKNWKGDSEVEENIANFKGKKAKPFKKENIKKEEAKDIKLSSKKEKVKINPTVKEHSLEGSAMGVNPFQRVVQSRKKELNEAFQHTWGYGTPEEKEYQEKWMVEVNEIIAAEGPHHYVDPLQLKVLYTTGVTPRNASRRILGYQSEGSSNYRRRRRLFHGQDDGGNTDEY